MPFKAVCKVLREKRELLEWAGLGVCLGLGAWLAFVGISQRANVPAEIYEEQKEIVVGLQHRAESLDLDHLTNIEEFDVMSNIHLSLVSNDSSGMVYPAVATSWNVDKDGTEFTFHLRKNLKFASGRAVTCDDALHTFNYLFGKEDESMWSLRLIASVQCKSRSDFVIRLKQPSPFILKELSDVRYSIRSFVDGKLDRMDGLGPYYVDSFDHHTGTIRLRRKLSHPLLSGRAASTILFHLVETYNEAKALLNEGKLHVFAMRGRRRDDDGNVLDSNNRARVWMVVLSRKMNQQYPQLAACLNDRFDRGGTLLKIGDESFTETSSVVPLSFAVLLNSNLQEFAKLGGGSCALNRPLRVMTMDFFDERITTPVVDQIKHLGIKISTQATIQKSTFFTELSTDHYDLALYSVGVSSSSAADLAYFYAHNPNFPPSYWVDHTTADLAMKLAKSHSELEAKDFATRVVGRGLRYGPLVPLFFESERYLASRCIERTDRDSIRPNQQFVTLVREKGCVD